IRSGLCLSLILIQLAGPAFCCCSAGVSGLPSAPTKPTDPVPACCSHQTAPKHEQVPAQRPGKPRRSCPCKQAPPAAAPVVTSMTSSASLAERAFAGPAFGDYLLPALVLHDP